MAEKSWRSGLTGWWASVRPAPGTLKDEAVAGVPRAAASVPDGMAAAALVGVNPIHGLYASFAGPIVGGMTASTRLMVITTTSAASLAAFSALEDVPAPDRIGALILLTLLAGAIMLVAGFFGLGRFTGFVSHSVMTGFLTGVAVNIILGQIDELTGATADGSNSLETAFDVVTSPGGIHLASLLVGVGALAILYMLPATTMGRYAGVVALVVPSLVVFFFNFFDGVAIVSDVGEITRGFPVPGLPDLSQLNLSLVSGALAVAAIVLVQGAGVAESAPNPDRSRTNMDTDFLAQGWANVASGLFRGIPVGGSVSQTALNISVGARDRWAAIMSGVWMLAILVALSGLAGQVAMPTLAAILIVASIAAIRPAEIGAVWKAGAQSQIAMVTTFVATLFLPVSAAVGIGVALSLLLSLNREALDVKVVRIEEGVDGRFIEGDVPLRLESKSVTVLDIYGSLFYAGARTLEEALPQVGSAESPVVIIRLRGRSAMGATAFSVISRYAGRLGDAGGRLYLSGVAPELVSHFKESGRIEASDPVKIIEATATLGESTREAIAKANSFLIGEAQDAQWDTPVRESWAGRTAHTVKGWFSKSE